MKIGVVGLGSIGKRHVTNLLVMGGHDILGCDARIGTDDWMSGLPIQAVSSPSYLLDWGPEAVLICTPPESHCPLALQALEVGAHVFIEKPIACHGWEIPAVLRKANKLKVQLAIGYQLRFSSLGIEPHVYDQVLRITHAQNMSKWSSTYPKQVLGEYSHEIDLACFLNGPAEKVVARQRDHGLRWNIELRHLHGASRIQLYAGETPYLRTIDASRGGRWMFEQESNDQAYKDELQAFLNACQYGHWDERLCSGVQAEHVMRIIEAAELSAETYRVVSLA